MPEARRLRSSAHDLGHDCPGRSLATGRELLTAQRAQGCSHAGVSVQEEESVLEVDGGRESELTATETLG